MILADFLHDNTESEKYLEKAVSSCLSDLDYAMIGYANVFFKNKDYDFIACKHNACIPINLF